MTRAMYDLQQTMHTNFDHTNITGYTADRTIDGESAADPEIAIESVFEKLKPVHNVNGRILFTLERRIAGEQFADYRKKSYVVDGRIEYTNLANFDDNVVKQIVTEMESVLNVDNITNTSWTHIFTGEMWNQDVVNPIVAFIITCKTRLEPATT